MPILVEWWWQLEARIAQARRAGELLLLLVDANGRVGSATSPFIGDAHPETENANGGRLHAALAAIDMCAPATFLDTGLEKAWTWQSAHGASPSPGQAMVKH